MQPSGQSNKDLKKIFESFDLDKNGSIDIKQIGNVAEKLGKTLPAQQLSQIMKKLDTNKDGKISFGQFQYWWTKGMQGKMAQIVYLKAKAMKMTNLIKNKFKNANISLEGHKGSPKPDIYSIKVQFGAEIPDSIKVDFGFYLKSSKQTELRERIKKYVPDFKNNLFGFVLKLPSKNPAQSKVALDHLFNFIIKEGALPIPIQNLQQNPFLKVKSIVRDQQLILQLCLQAEFQNVIAPVSNQVQGIVNAVGDGFYSNVDFNFSINSSFDNILNDPLFNNLLKGFNLNFSIQANNSTLGKLRKFAQKQQLGLPALFNLITLFRCAKLKLKIKSPEQLSKFFKKLGIQDVVTSLPTLKDILQDQSKNMIQQAQNDKLLNLLYRFSQYAFKHVQNDVINQYYLGANLGTGSLRFQGKNVSKIHSILFNQL